MDEVFTGCHHAPAHVNDDMGSSTSCLWKGFPGKSFLSLENPDIARLAREDPRGTSRQLSRWPHLGRGSVCPGEIRVSEDCRGRGSQAGRFVVTGPRQFGRPAVITESLAGRAAFLLPLPFTLAELSGAGGVPSDPLEAIVKGFRAMPLTPLYTIGLGFFECFSMM